MTSTYCCSLPRESRTNGSCIPLCLKECINGKCVGCGDCLCSKGYTKHSKEPHRCVPFCRSGCDNGRCVGPEKCICNDGYEKNQSNQCVKHCNKKCLYEETNCVDVATCQCLPGYFLNVDELDVCRPICEIPCYNGTCIKPNSCSCAPGFELFTYDSQNKIYNQCKPICDRKCIHGTCYGNNKCKCFIGYENDENDSGNCKPICTNECINGNCVGSNRCECYPHYNATDLDRPNLCLPVCDKKCGDNAECVAPNYCKCHQGYQLNKRSNKCLPVCREQPENGICVAPETYECFPGYKANDPKRPYVCQPVCNNTCINGNCIEPNKCSCFLKYNITDLNKPHICKPICNKKCVNGRCISPDKCKCFDGYKLDEREINTCILDKTKQSTCIFCLNGDCSNEICTCKTHFITSSVEEHICVPFYRNSSNNKCMTHKRCDCLWGFENAKNAFGDDYKKVCDLKKSVQDVIKARIVSGYIRSKKPCILINSRLKVNRTSSHEDEDEYLLPLIQLLNPNPKKIFFEIYLECIFVNELDSLKLICQLKSQYDSQTIYNVKELSSDKVNLNEVKDNELKISVEWMSFVQKYNLLQENFENERRKRTCLCPLNSEDK